MKLFATDHCRDESANFAQKHDEDLAKDVVRPNVQEEIRKQVDLMLEDQVCVMAELPVLCVIRKHVDYAFRAALVGELQEAAGGGWEGEEGQEGEEERQGQKGKGQEGISLCL